VSHAEDRHDRGQKNGRLAKRWYYCACTSPGFTPIHGAFLVLHDQSTWVIEKFPVKSPHGRLNVFNFGKKQEKKLSESKNKNVAASWMFLL
jgi:hypothetical protein